MPDPSGTRPAAGGRFLLALLLAALAVRLGWIAIGAESLPQQVEGNPWSDSRAYDTLARQLARGHEYKLDGNRSMYPPGYPLFLAAVYALFGERPWVAMVVNALLGALLVVLVYAVGCRFVPRAAAFLATGILIVHPSIVDWTDRLQTEELYAFLLALALWMCTRGRPFGAGLAAGGAVLTRIPGLFPAALLGAWWLVAERTWRRRLLAAGIFALGVGLPLVPWAVHNQRVLGTPTISVSMGPWLWNEGTKRAKVDNESLADALWAGGDEGARYRAQMSEALERIRTSPGEYLAHCVDRVHRFWYPPLMWPEIGRPWAVAGTALALLLVGAAFAGVRPRWVWGGSGAVLGALCAWRGDLYLFGPQFGMALALVPAMLLWRRSLWLLALAVWASVPYILTSATHRYRFGTEPYVLLFAAAGAVWAAAAVAQWSWRPALKVEEEGEPLPRWLLGVLLFLAAIFVCGLGVVVVRQVFLPAKDPYVVSPGDLPRPAEGALGTSDYEMVHEHRLRHRGFLDGLEGCRIDWVGVVRYPVAEEDYGGIVRFQPPQGIRCIFMLWLFRVEGQEAAERREVLVFSPMRLPEGVGEGDAVRIRGFLRGVESHRGLVVEVDEIVPWEPPGGRPGE